MKTEKELKRLNEEIKLKKSQLLLPFILLVLGLSFLTINNQVSAVGEVFFCAEKTLSGAWCQNVPANQIDTRFRQAQTSCEATSFCRLGTCVNSRQGECRPNVPQRVCQQGNGVWILGEPDEIPQCQLGCCMLGDQAAFVTQTKCKALSSDYGIETNYRTDIRTETACIESASPDVKGACVLDDGFERKCRLLTKSECQALESTSGAGNLTIEFNEGLLCSAESLGTNCGPTQRTTCVADKDEVYFLDTCGNLANIYDAAKVNNQEYWTDIKEKSESCNPNGNNAGSATCGSCDYLLGSTCKPVERGNAATPSPRYGNFVCADLSCNYEGKEYQHGETWCGGTSGIDRSLPGSQYTKFACYSGEVTAEQCASFRQEICIEDEIVPGFSSAQCTANLWQDCTIQESKKDCENTDKRDCNWIVGQSLLRDESGTALVVDSEGKLVQKEDDDSRKGASCVPKYAPGFDFWNAESEAEELCAIASDNCVVKFERGAIGAIGGSDYSCKENCECVGLKKGDKLNKAENAAKNSLWAKERNNMCIALGDCGNKKNYIGVQGYHNESVVEIKSVEN